MRAARDRMPCRPLVVAALCLAVLAAAPSAATAQGASAPAGIYTCFDNTGRRLTADRPIFECRDREQRILNRDGSLRAILPPTLTAEERAEKELRERRAAELRAAQADAVRRDRNLMMRYPNEEAHQRAREASLEAVRLAIRASEDRLKDLAAERKPLMNEAEFYVGRALPAKLRSQIEANDASVEAQRQAAATQKAELDRIVKLYDAELERLRRLWAGAVPGTLGPMSPAQALADGIVPAAAPPPR